MQQKPDDSREVLRQLSANWVQQTWSESNLRSTAKVQPEALSFLIDSVVTDDAVKEYERHTLDVGGLQKFVEQVLYEVAPNEEGVITDLEMSRAKEVICKNFKIPVVCECKRG